MGTKAVMMRESRRGEHPHLMDRGREAQTVDASHEAGQGHATGHHHDDGTGGRGVGLGIGKGTRGLGLDLGPETGGGIEGPGLGPETGGGITGEGLDQDQDIVLPDEDHQARAEDHPLVGGHHEGHPTVVVVDHHPLGGHEEVGAGRPRGMPKDERHQPLHQEAHLEALDLVPARLQRNQS